MLLLMVLTVMRTGVSEQTGMRHRKKRWGKSTHAQQCPLSPAQAYAWCNTNTHMRRQQNLAASPPIRSRRPLPSRPFVSKATRHSGCVGFRGFTAKVAQKWKLLLFISKMLKKTVHYFQYLRNKWFTTLVAVSSGTPFLMKITLTGALRTTWELRWQYQNHTHTITIRVFNTGSTPEEKTQDYYLISKFDTDKSVTLVKSLIRNWRDDLGS